MVLYSSNKFGGLKPIFNQSQVSIQAFNRLPNKFIGNSNIGREFLKSSKVFLGFPQK